ncbi:hypothetical protein [Stenotrophomonas sp. 24(2023)]|uniref:hypothetical protein n=1 Tax=Stenotrophomonas sp. 24(2023) TaxID=3068324 RepID=UPI0027DFA1F7|nr:hypothetical protein [Stenotrophomonas sp. 24(2023)]WMJ71109.1 hypothetical protein Q9R17_08455 [Stenotrophomonas sp. 24(2023)]
MPRLERPAPSVFNVHLDPLGARSAQRRARQAAEPQAVAQDYQQYMRSDYERRRSQGHRSWRDLCAAYAFALSTHAADWPRGGDADTDEELAAHWEQMRGQSRLSWQQARPVVEDAWMALDHMPAAAVRPLLQ